MDRAPESNNTNTPKALNPCPINHKMVVIGSGGFSRGSLYHDDDKPKHSAEVLLTSNSETTKCTLE